MPIQTGYYATPFSQNPMEMPVPPNATYNILVEEGQRPEPPQPGLLQRVGQNIADSAREGAMNQAGQMGAAVGAGAATLGGQALRRIGGAVRDGAVRTFDWENGYLWRAADQIGDIILNPFGRQIAAAQALADPLLGEGAGIAGLTAMEEQS